MDDMDVPAVFANLNLGGADGSIGGSGGGRSGDGEVPMAPPEAPTLTSRAARGPSPDPKTVRKNGASPGRKIVAYADGACKGNHKPAKENAKRLAGIGVWWDLEEFSKNEWIGTLPVALSERLPGTAQTCNRAELYAILRALEKDPDPTAKFEIKTSSEYSVKCVTKGLVNGLPAYLPKWESDARDGIFFTANGKKVENQDLIKAILALKRIREKYCKDGVEIVHVKKNLEDIKQRKANNLADLGTKKQEDKKEKKFDEIQRDGGYGEFKRLS